jgi:hypothetical protein
MNQNGTGEKEREVSPHVATIENLYTVFSKYQKPKSLDAAPTRDAKAIYADLTSTGLRELKAENLERYAPFAVTTVGTLGDYKHFLPRILELSVSDELHTYGLEANTIAGKLLYGEFFEWPDDEKDSVRAFVTSAFLNSCHETMILAAPANWLDAMAKLDCDLNFVSSADFPLTPATKLNRALAIKELLVQINDTRDDPTTIYYNGAKSWLLTSNIEETLLAGIEYVNEFYAWELESAFDDLQKLVAASKAYRC